MKLKILLANNAASSLRKKEIYKCTLKQSMTKYKTFNALFVPTKRLGDMHIYRDISRSTIRTPRSANYVMLKYLPKWPLQNTSCPVTLSPADSIKKTLSSKILGPSFHILSCLKHPIFSPISRLAWALHQREWWFGYSARFPFAWQRFRRSPLRAKWRTTPTQVKSVAYWWSLYLIISA